MPRTEDFERFGELDPEWRKAYLKRPIDRLPQDVTAACDELRRQRKEINTLRGQLFRSNFMNTGYAGILGGLAFKGLTTVLAHFLK